MPLWLDLIRTPMAAPESAALRRMRFVWQLLCLACAGGVGFFSHFHQFAGRRAPVVIAVLLAATGLYTALYLGLKHRADTDFLNRVGDTE